MDNLKLQLIFTTILGFITLYCMPMYADLIITKSGETITAYNIEIGSKSIFYTLDSKEDSPAKKIAIEEVFAYKIGDGEMQTMKDSNTEKESQETLKNVATAPVQAKAVGDNASIISSYSAGEYKLDIKPNKGEAKRAVVFYRPTSNSILSSEDVAISLEAGVTVGDEWHSAMELSKNGNRNTSAASLCELKVGVTNKTNKPIYLDLAQTVRNGEIPGGYRSFYDGTVTTEGGASSGAMGISVLGIGLGSSSTAGNTITKNQPNIMMVPPHSTVYLPPYGVFSDYDKKIYYDYDHLGYTKKALSTANKFGDMTIGQIKDFDENTTPSTIDYTIAYGFDSNITEPQLISCSLYISRAIGLKTLYDIWTGKYEDRLNRIINMDPQTLVGSVFLK